jgi:hypothetical protein
VSLEDRIPDTSVLCEFLRFSDGQSAFDRHRTINMNDVTTRQKTTSQPGKAVTQTGTPQIIDQHKRASCGLHFPHQYYGIIFCQVMQKQAAHHNIILGLRKRILQRVAKCKPNIFSIRRRRLASRKSDGRRTDIAAFDIHCNPFPFSSLGKSNGKIAAAGGNVQDGNRTIQTGALEIPSYGSPDGQISPAPPVDPPQSSQSLFMRDTVEGRVVHQLRLEIS